MTCIDENDHGDVALVRYLDALDEKDFDTLEAIWKQAESDPGLEAVLVEANAELLLDHAPAPPEEPTAESLVHKNRLETIEKDLAATSIAAPEQIVDAIYSDYRCRVLVVDDNPDLLAILRLNLAKEFEVLEAHSLASAKAVFYRQPIDILLADLCLQGPRSNDTSGIELIEWARAQSPRTVSLLMSAYGETENVIEAINRGQIFHFFSKPFPRPELLLETLRRASHAFTLERKNQELLERLKEMNGVLEETVRQRTRDLREAMHDLRKKNKMLEELALTDVLTGLPNRRAMDHLVERDLLWRKRNPAPLTLALVDIDHFKNVNTQYRWTGGDRVLAEVSRCLSTSLREIDHIGRYGGEEFLLLAPQADRHGAEVLGERLRSRVENMPIHYRGQEIRATVSIGMAVLEKDGKADLEQMKDVCEQALARAKKEGRNRCVITTIPAEPAILSQRARG